VSRKACSRECRRTSFFPLVVSLRKKFSALRQIVRPQREIVGTLSDGKLKLIRSVMVPYLRDLTEDLARIEGQANAWAEQLILSFRVYLNRSSHEANEGIRVLTGITALTIPVLIFAGWFGMNFSNMHELEWKYGYAGAAALVLVSTIAMLRFMRKRKWL
jgi:magnesium transporter